ncbi:MAG TPA: pseudouridine synthase [Eubacteriales bacterium]|nr:pseudouridine synthase [Clostridia bacterium]HRV73861.1 pseudouridine synthase [Eubacteriales bacterium]
MRLQKYLADAGIASRRACETIIAEGRVTINGEAAHVGSTVDENADVVLLDGKPVKRAERRVVIMLYKPRGVVCTSTDPEGRRTVQEFVKDIPERLYNVGRLDLNSEGLLLMTNDGELANRLMHPRYKVNKTYFAVCDGKLTASEAAKLTNGVMLDDGMTAPATVSQVKPTSTGDTALCITIHEGRNRQIRRMLEAVGHKTLRLKREAYGPLSLGELRSGQWRYLTDEEQKQLDRQ